MTYCQTGSRICYGEYLLRKHTQKLWLRDLNIQLGATVSIDPLKAVLIKLNQDPVLLLIVVLRMLNKELGNLVKDLLLPLTLIHPYLLAPLLPRRPLQPAPLKQISRRLLLLLRLPPPLQTRYPLLLLPLHPLPSSLQLPGPPTHLLLHLEALLVEDPQQVGEGAGAGEDVRGGRLRQ